jgi:hypothetical protein
MEHAKVVEGSRIMDNELTKITLTFQMRYGTPNRNGCVFTKEAIENAFGSSNPQLPIIVHNRNGEYCIGATTPRYYFDWDEKNKVCKATIEGYLFYAAPRIRINEMQDGKITDCDIMSIDIRRTKQ